MGHHNTIELIEGDITSFEPPRDYQYGKLSIQINKESCSRRGPMFLGNKIVGLYPGFGYEIIPASVMKNFLDGLEERHTSFGSIDIWYQTMEDAQLRKHFKMTHDMTGALIIDFVPLSNAIKVLKLHDVILEIEGYPVDNDGTIRHVQRKQLFSFDHLISVKKPGETALVRFLRDGKEHVFDFSLNFTEQQPLVPYKFLPSYYIVAGFVFVPLSKPYVDKSSAICKCALKRAPKTDGEQIVIISQVLSDDMVEYRNFKDFEVKKVNGVEVVNLKHLIEFVENCCTEDLRFDLEGGYVIVLNKKSAKEATSLVLERNEIPSAKSSDLQIGQDLRRLSMKNIGVSEGGEAVRIGTDLYGSVRTGTTREYTTQLFEMFWDCAKSGPRCAKLGRDENMSRRLCAYLGLMKRSLVVKHQKRIKKILCGGKRPMRAKMELIGYFGAWTGWL
ncbi:hypothetical protein F2Q68_00015158 [Brassica cretica]|uniref:Protease Do-like PDZ domain-containing protein n=1 Tax=Brassica cretica TaxID=69181 RepID=A0A8S9HGL6_BRACR|nr:hypothetical protein F2Q68_00015158 [Brassica cretica]